MPRSTASSAPRPPVEPTEAWDLNHVSPLEKLRFERGLTQGEVSRGSGVDLRTLRYYETNQREPLGPQLAKLATFFGVDAAELLNQIRAARGGWTGRRVA